MLMYRPRRAVREALDLFSGNWWPAKVLPGYVSQGESNAKKEILFAVLIKIL